MDYKLLFLVLFVFMVLIISRCLRIVREDCRLVIFRLGRFLRVAGPGPVFVSPHIDEVQLINLNEALPHWLSLTQEQLNEEIRILVLTGRIITKK